MIAPDKVPIPRSPDWTQGMALQCADKVAQYDAGNWMLGSSTGLATSVMAPPQGAMTFNAAALTGAVGG